MSGRLVAALAALLIVTSCAATKPAVTGPIGGVVVLPVKASVFVRTTFDSDATSIIGAFIPDDVADGDLDEAHAARTQCSDYIKPKRIAASGEVEEVFGASASVGGKLGIKGVAQIAGERSNSNALRIKYNATQKIVADVDTKGLYECCQASPDQCSRRYITMSIAGDGRIYAATETADKLGGEGEGTYKGIPIAGDVMYKDGVKWERTTEFKGQFFAFSFAQQGLGKAAKEFAVDDCSWTKKLPKSQNGVYFVGVSPQADAETMARKKAMEDARSQVVKYIGEWLEESSRSTESSVGPASAVTTELADATTAERLGAALVSQVKDEQWCGPEMHDTPKGQMQVMKTLAFFPYTERSRATKSLITNLIDMLKAKGTLSPAKEAQLKAALDAVK